MAVNGDRKTSEIARDHNQQTEMKSENEKGRERDDWSVPYY